MSKKGSDLIRLSGHPDNGLSRGALYSQLRAGELEQIAPGYFLRPGTLDDTTAGLASIALRRPDATICLLSALAMHDLTDEIPQATDIALHRNSRRLSTENISISWHFFDPATFDLGRENHALTHDINIGLYNPERSIIDAIRLRHRLGADIGYSALKIWLRQPGNHPSKLLKLSKHFPHAHTALLQALEILL